MDLAPRYGSIALYEVDQAGARMAFERVAFGVGRPFLEEAEPPYVVGGLSMALRFPRRNKCLESFDGRCPSSAPSVRSRGCKAASVDA